MFPLEIPAKYIDSCKKPILKIACARKALLLGAGQEGEGVKQGVEVLHVPHLHHLERACLISDCILQK